MLQVVYTTAVKPVLILFQLHVARFSLRGQQCMGNCKERTQTIEIKYCVVLVNSKLSDVDVIIIIVRQVALFSL